MSFDSNPSAVYHGVGYGELRHVATATFDMSSANDDTYYVSDTGAITVGDFTERVLLVKVKSDHADAKTGDVLNPVSFDDIAEQAVTAGSDAPTASNGLIIPLDGQQIYLSRGSGGHLVLGGSDVSDSFGTGTVTVGVYEMR